VAIRGTFHSFDPVGFAIFAILVVDHRILRAGAALMLLCDNGGHEFEHQRQAA
jgi:hypothetical protein